MATRIAGFLALLLAAHFGATPCMAEDPPAPVPFGIDQRPMPSGSDLSALIPTIVGSFQRKPLDDDVRQQPNETPTFAVYSNGPDAIFFGVRLAEDSGDARNDVVQSRLSSNMSSSEESFSAGTEPSYYRVPQLMTWSRGRYFFYAQANRQSALDTFMRAFPY